MYNVCFFSSFSFLSGINVKVDSYNSTFRNLHKLSVFDTTMTLTEIFL